MCRGRKVGDLVLEVLGGLADAGLEVLEVLEVLDELEGLEDLAAPSWS